jgi:hypothetical protein
MSRHPVQKADIQKKSWVDLQVERVYSKALDEYNINYLSGCEGISITEVKRETAVDPVLQKLVASMVTQKWHDLDENIKPYKPVKDELSLADGLIL